MSASKMVAVQGAKERTAATVTHESDLEYGELLGRLQDAERRYKLGDVDEERKSADDPSQTYWAFEEELNGLEKLLRKHQERLLREQPSWYYKFLAIQAEAKSYFDTATLRYRLDLYLLGQKLYRDLLEQKRHLPEQRGARDTEQEIEERRTLKNIIRVILMGLEYPYSIGDFGTAINQARSLYDFVMNSGLVTKEDPAYGTRAIIYYFLGRALRQRGLDDDYQQAIDYFYQCSEYYFEMARRRGNNEMDVIYARTRAMVSLAFGAGFLFYNAQSDLVRAKAQIAQARLAFLKDNGTICCKLHYYYLELLYASILRAEAGELTGEGVDEDEQKGAERAAAQEKLDQAIKILDDCGKALKNKPKYFIHTLYNKALVCLYRGPKYYDGAREYINELMQRCQDNPRWLANGLILKSHLERRVGNTEAALADALRAYNQAGNHLPVRIEALLACGQAQLERHHFTAARADFEKAAQLNNGANLKLDAMAHLLLAELAVAQQKPQEAYERFIQARALMPSIRHGFILNKYRQLETRIADLQTDFFIPGNAADLDYKKHEADLQRWLLQKALREGSNLTQVARSLNVSKKTIYMWLDKYQIKI